MAGKIFENLILIIFQSWSEPTAEQVKNAEYMQAADIHLLSNHRKEWLADLLEPITPYIKTNTISSEVGCCKPDPTIYKLVHSQINHDSRKIYVDDQEKNLVPAKQLGWITVIADKEGKWMDDVSFFLLTS